MNAVGPSPGATRFRSRRAVGVLPSLAVALVLGSTPVARAGGNELMSFAADMAKQGNWREAKYRWEQARLKKENDPRILNNLAVAHEALGQPATARKLYARALALAGSDERIENNQIRFERFWDRVAASTGADRDDRSAGRRRLGFDRDDGLAVEGQGQDRQGDRLATGAAQARHHRLQDAAGRQLSLRRELARGRSARNGAVRTQQTAQGPRPRGSGHHAGPRRFRNRPWPIS